MKFCVNHPDKKAFSICHSCGKDYCESCLDEGKEFYYCKNPECQKKLKEELASERLPLNIVCQNCSSVFEISSEEISSGKIQCPECKELIDFSEDRPRVLDKSSYVELLSSLNQADIALIKSILENSKIHYYVFGENLSSLAMAQPTRFFVNECQLEAAKEVLKDIKLNIWGYSKNQY
jgi:ssDNA-binding Zn-finger/Zn-ribbon topoisomerase 1